MMPLAPLEYVVIRVHDDRFAKEILPALADIQHAGNVRVVDLLFVAKDEVGTVAAREVHELAYDDLKSLGDLPNDLQGLLTTEDIAVLAGDLPVAESAVILVVEHCWAQKLGDAVGRAGGKVWTGGIVQAEALARVNLELAAVPA